MTEKFGPNVAEAGSLLANKFGEEAKAKRNEAAIALEEAEKAKAENNNETNRTLVKQARDNFETASREAKEWETGGSQRLVIDSALNVISTALAGRPAAEVVASGLSPAVNNQIKKATTDAKGNVNTALNLTAHALWGAVEAYAGNRNVAAGAAGAAGGEVAANFLASTLYNKSPEKLSEEEKRTVSSLSQVAAGIAGGSLSDSSDGAIIAAKTAKDAVENNSFTLESVINNPQEAWAAKAEGEAKLIEEKSNIEQSLREEHPIIMQLADGTYAVVSTTGKIIYTIGPIIAAPELLAGQITYKIATQVALGLAANTGTQIASGQPFNWYELAGAGMGAVISPRLKSANDVIRVNMGIGMATGLASGSDPIEGAGLAGIGAAAGLKVKNPYAASFASEFIQKIPTIYRSYRGVGNDKEEK